MRRNFCILLGVLLAVAAPAATNTVTTLADSGAGSLRQAIADAAADDTVTFAVTGGGLALGGLTLPTWLGLIVWLSATALAGLAIGLLESTLARLSLKRLPYFMAVAIALGAFSLIVQVGGIR